MAACLLALGANIGESQTRIEQALDLFHARDDMAVHARSGVISTQPIGGPAGQEPFANAVAIMETSLAPHELLSELQSIEQHFGRQREARWAARTLDLDLLLVDTQVIDTPELTVPHPRLSFRPFVLEPAVEIAADWRHPLLLATLGELHQRLHDGDDAVVLYGGSDDDRQWHAEQLAATFDALRLQAGREGECTLVCGDATSAAAPKLAIQLRNTTEPPRPGMPTLVVPAVGRGEVLFDTVAAIEAVWPDLDHHSSEG